MNNSPTLRFKGFNANWELKKLNTILTESKITGNNGANARKLTVKLWGKGVYPKDDTGSENTNYFKRSAGQIIYSKLDFLNCAFGIIPDSLDGYESTVDLPAFDVKNQYDSRFILEKIKQRNFYIKFGEQADGSRKARRVHADTFLNFEIYIPQLDEQQRIADFTSSIDSLIEILYLKKKSIVEYKNIVRQKIFSQQLRLKDEYGKNFPDWEERKLVDVLVERKERNLEGIYNEVFSVAKEKGVVNQIEHLGRSYAAENLLNYKVTHPYDVLYTKSPTASFPYGIIKQNKTGRVGLVSTLYAVYIPDNKYLGSILHEYFSSWINTYNYLNPIVHKGAKNTINIGNEDFLKGRKIKLPTSQTEQQKISSLFSSLDALIELSQNKIIHAEYWKKGLVQKMFI